MAEDRSERAADVPANDDRPAQAGARLGADAVEVRLSRLDDYELEDGYPDIRGWPVRGSNGRELGIVGDLLVDTRLLEVAAIDVNLGVGAAGVRGNVVGSARVPIASVRIRRDRYIVVDVDLIPCDDVLEPVGDGRDATRRVPCGQIGIRKRDDTQRTARPAAAPHDIEVALPAATHDVSRTADEKRHPG